MSLSSTSVSSTSSSSDSSAIGAGTYRKEISIENASNTHEIETRPFQFQNRLLPSSAP